MDVFSVFFLSCVSVLVGIIVTLLVQYYVLYFYFKKSPIAETTAKYNADNYSLPEDLKKKIDANEVTENSSLPITLILQFLFHELRHSESIKCWLYKKLSLEFDELLSKTTIGKFFDTIRIKDMHLGTQFPDVKNIAVENIKLDKNEGYIDSISVDLDIDYSGNFLLCIDGKMKFGKNAFLSIKVNKIVGKIRLQFTRNPYTHWSFAFVNDPHIELAVESHFQGRQLQSNITNLIINQIKKAIRRKHTLPNYKIRYKPFFVKTDPSQLDVEDSEIIPQGQLEVNCAEISRLATPSGLVSVYCTLSIDSIAWLCVYQKDESTNMTLEVTVTKKRQVPLGVIFKQDLQSVIVESICPMSPAGLSGLKCDDVIIAVENKAATSVSQVSKLIKSSSGSNITFRVERKVENYVFKVNKNEVVRQNSRAESGDEELLQLEQDNFVIVDNVRKEKSKILRMKNVASNENVSKLAQTLGNFSLRKRKTSTSDRSDKSDNSAKTTPNSSTPGTPQHSLKQAMSIPSLMTTKKHSICELPEILKQECQESETSLPLVNEIQKSKSLNINPAMFFNEEYQFALRESDKYLNVNVWGTFGDGQDVILGYANIPLNHVLNECCNSALGHYIRNYSFLPPTNVMPNNQTHPLFSHSGFEHVFCYGDVLLSFIWTHDEVDMKRKQSSAVDLDSVCETNVNVALKHDFVRTQFHRTTLCDFCTKKIWLKDAVQCRNCNLCCHKKCIAKCQQSTGCNPIDKNSLKSEQIDLAQPEITMTDMGNDMSDVEDKNGFEAGATSSLKRVNSVNSLAIPGSQISHSISRSLPPSPQRTPSRKQSLINMNPFTECPTILEEIQKQNTDSEELINKLLEQVLVAPADEFLMDAAKESGQKLYINIPHSELSEKVNVMMAELKKTLDTVTMEHMDLTKQMNNEESEMKKTKIAFLMGQADAKVHGLSVLMLHYCSSLQHTQEKIV